MQPASKSPHLNERAGNIEYVPVTVDNRVPIIMYLRALSAQVALHSINRKWFQENEQLHFTIAEVTKGLFLQAIKECDAFSIQHILTNGFYVKKFYWQGQGQTGQTHLQGTSKGGRGGAKEGWSRAGNRVDFLASTDIIPDMNSPGNLENDFKSQGIKGNYIAKCSCQAGQIGGLITKPKTKGEAKGAKKRDPFHKFRQCGFASILSYFCFLDEDHLPAHSGYKILDSQGTENPWNNGNMPNLRSAPGNFNNNRCKIIYAINHYNTGHLSVKDRKPQKGSKAILYAAYAAGFDEMVAYKNPPCRTSDPNCPCPSVGSDGNVQMGNSFNLGDIINGFNRAMNPNVPDQSDAEFELIHFDRHFGNQWYFCQRRRRRT